ncbi:hypothetical protein EFA69_16090 [Rufibacter immobilis]|uniref:Uncharacterized protein n=1 Tax=Rufibacter immobilis TaxID=1348778 RepID=A0A3M9MR09_9BACT|nr:hypothetical protein [Rufibacter immobilis]RNI27637.1 hypothetical protein EFA69_16090 [Rufibacter immobilis]
METARIEFTDQTNQKIFINAERETENNSTTITLNVEFQPAVAQNRKVGFGEWLAAQLIKKVGEIGKEVTEEVRPEDPETYLMYGYVAAKTNFMGLSPRQAIQEFIELRGLDNSIQNMASFLGAWALFEASQKGKKLLLQDIFK